MSTPYHRENLSYRKKILNIALPHHDLVESSSCFFEAYYPVFTDNLPMRSAASDQCFPFQVCNNKLNGIAGAATDG